MQHAGDGTRAFRPRLPDGSGEAIHHLLEEIGRGTRWTLVRWRTEPAWFAGDYAGPQGRRVTVYFHHLEEPAKQPSVVTKQFRIALAKDAPGGLELLRRSAELTRRWETRWRWACEPEGHHPDAGPELVRDIEHVGLEAGLRRGIRVHADPGEADEIMARYRAAGAHVLLGPQPSSGDPGARLVYVAEDRASAHALAAAERRRDSATLGRLLGYPDCCVASFVERARAHDHTEEYRAARDAWVPRPAHRLNALMFGPGVRFISFEPCRYDCPRALQVADATAEALAQKSPDSVARIDQRLACCLAIGPGSPRALVELALPERRIVEATALLGRAVEPPDVVEAFARALVGRSVSERGEVRDSGVQPGLVIDFAGLGAFARTP